MKHKIKVHSSPPKRSYGRGYHLWYVRCLECEWQPSEMKPVHQDGVQWFGRGTWQEAFAEGVIHQIDSWPPEGR